MERFLQNATDINSGLGWCPFGDVLLAKTLVLTIQKYGNNNLFTLAGETRTEIVGNGLRRFEGWCCEFPGTNAFPEFKCGFDLSDLCRTKTGYFQQVINAGAIETPQSSEILQNRESRLVGVRSRNTFLKCS